MFFQSYFVFLSCLYYISLFNKREKEKTQAWQVFGAFLLLCHIYWIFILPSGYSSFYKMSVAFSFI